VLQGDETVLLSFVATVFVAIFYIWYWLF